MLYLFIRQILIYIRQWRILSLDFQYELKLNTYLGDSIYPNAVWLFPACSFNDSPLTRLWLDSAVTSIGNKF